ncbi:MAG: glycosyltransferase [Dysgonamonadaceae bacterium]|nr:glycosyltransferase [Dysgonamonadaceae bacterium]
MNEEIKISVITVVRNGEKTLESTMLSVLNQTYGNIEYIVIDGASKDKTVDILIDYASKIACGAFPNVSFRWMSEPDKGIYDAMNKGINLAAGEWINFMNSGDRFYENGVLSDIFSHKEYLDADIIYGDTRVFTEKYSRVEKHREMDFKKRQLGFCHQSSFTKTALLKENKFDDSLKILADYKFFYQCYLQGKKFRYCHVIVSSYDNNGFSENNPMLMIKEYNAVHGTENRVIFDVFIHYYRKFVPEKTRNWLKNIVCRK